MKNSAATKKSNRVKRDSTTAAHPPVEERVRALLEELKKPGTKVRREEMGPKYGIQPSANETPPSILRQSPWRSDLLIPPALRHAGWEKMRFDN